jgi:hypothetical protein
MSNSRLVFVFGSNLAGKHGRGDALVALQAWGAQNGVSTGPQGSAYAIPTQDTNRYRLTTKTIERYIRDFCEYARRNPSTTFQVTRIGCGPGGYEDHQIAPYFLAAPANCTFSPEWVAFFNQTVGTNPWTTNPHPTPGPSVLPSPAFSSSST